MRYRSLLDARHMTRNFPTRRSCKPQAYQLSKNGELVKCVARVYCVGWFFNWVAWATLSCCGETARRSPFSFHMSLSMQWHWYSFGIVLLEDQKSLFKYIARAPRVSNFLQRNSRLYRSSVTIMTLKLMQNRYIWRLLHVYVQNRELDSAADPSRTAFQTLWSVEERVFLFHSHSIQWVSKA